MSEIITLTIDGKEIKAKDGETVLNIARANGIFIPAICYLTRAPTWLSTGKPAAATQPAGARAPIPAPLWLS